ncbi:hypothetical protein BEWA_000710 [Theileria equi strain WA]|uniref:Signal peptide containing protein n=1 Tax=Theileria equi strain WA TaxID=1537102 RepID=L0B075_THEEQ|nr:hypothetical protein BEWA_000710 [Theileria equi strain WA]AFZ80666.1 hypothetical protein BEWA_000710 [Theileria equi strain WA]|eukprot:XP_004830332.1 hypothetical protein BEWA_000710 [Theileria equi strain WA]
MGSFLVLSHIFIHLVHYIGMYTILLTTKVPGENIILDIRHQVQTEHYNCFIQTRDVITHVSFSLNPFSRAIKVVDGGLTIWEPQEVGEKCSSLTFHTHYDLKVLAYIYIVNGRKINYIHYKYKGGLWSVITIGEYRMILRKILGKRRFDISNPDSLRYFTVQSHTEEQAPAKMYIPLPMYSIIDIQDTGQTIWKAGVEGERATFIVIHGHDGMPRFMHMYIRKDSCFETLYFEKLDTGRWTNLYKDVFFKKMAIYRPYDTRL